MNRNLQIDNRTLVEECKNGDKEALNLFYIRFAPRMLSVVRRYVSDTKDAEDILHDGFIVAFTRLDSLRDFDKVDYWLATIMKNLSLQFLHSQDVGMVLHDIPDIEDTPEIDDIIDLDTLESLIRKLPDGYQKVFRLAVLENKSHKDISKLLGIAPNSSSSQLFHAKLMMRKLIVEYRRQAGVFSLLLVVVAAGVIFRRSQGDIQPESHLQLAENVNVESREEVAGNVENSSEATPSIPANVVVPQLNVSVLTGSIRRVDPSVAVVAKGGSEDTEEPSGDIVDKHDPNLIAGNTDSPEAVSPEEGSVSRSDSVTGVVESPYYAQLDDNIINKLKGDDWSFRLGVNPGIFSINNAAVDNGFMDSNSSGIDGSEGNPGGDDNDKKDETRSGFTRGENSVNYKDYKGISHHNYLPVSFYLAVNKRLSGMLSVESGLSYTYLHSTFETDYTRSHCHWHYIGIPLKLNFKTFSTDKIRLYATFGGEVDFPVYSNADVTNLSGVPDLRSGRFDSSVVWSLSASYGVSFKLSRRVEIFLEPTLQYHFEHNHEVPNIWTDNPWGFSLPIGFRFNF